MRRRRLLSAWLCAVAVLTTVACSGTGQSVSSEVIARSAEAVVTVTSSIGFGSGVVWNAEGRVVVTARHVVGDDARATVITAGGPVTATVLTDPGFDDIAVLVLEQAVLPASPPLADALVGAPVALIGRPVDAGLRHSLGRVTGIDQALPGRGAGGDDLVELDALVRAGDSGGGVFDAGGRLVAITIAGSSTDESGEGSRPSFAVPARRVAALVEALLRGEVQTPAFLGIDAATVTSELADTHGLEPTTGVAVLAVQPGTPADTAGLVYRDVITAFDGRPLARVTDLDLELARARPGTTVALTVLRDGRPLEIAVTLAARPARD